MAAADPSTWDDRQLIQQAKDGNRDAFRILMQRYMKQAYSVAFRFVGSHDGAEDITQEAFVKVYQSLPSFRGDAEFLTWLHRIIVNLALTKKRIEKVRVERTVHVSSVENIAGTAENHHDDIVVGEQRAHIERALHELPTLQRAVVILRHVNGLSTRQVSGILRCTEGTVKTHLFRGLKKMKSRLEVLEPTA